MATSIDPDLLVKRNAFTKETYRDVYPAIDPTQPELSQAGKVVVITGATRGLGQLGFAASFARANAKALALLGRSAAGLAETEKLVKNINPGIEVYSITVDVTDAAKVAKAFDEIVARFGVPHVLVNNAGTLEAITPMMDSDLESWWNTQEVNVKGTLIATKAFLSKTGTTPVAPTTIINLTSGASMAAPPGIGSYSLSKLAVTKLAEYVQAEYPAVTAISLDPGIVPTDMGLSVPFLAPFIGDTPELVGGTAVWLATGDKTFLSGRYVSVNWDVVELETRKEDITGKELLKICYRS
ncbi:hypothetical protein BDW59DRAFT_153925 [Aspergillus cavernicola]|uniref:Ketoreductase domain-containing protein n=1 Tax=Aspergillus cavernicola TaxID=176166 RepID=A0ABR4HIF1_9EURO